MILFESCVDSLEAALASERGGAGRIELCAGLDAGGLTPAPALVEQCAAQLTIQTFVMVRPRAGDFVYNPDEVRAMVRDVAVMTRAGAHGIVFGALTEAGTVDREVTRRLIDAARPSPVTFHRAMDVTNDPLEALAVLIEFGVDRVLTSGGASTAIEGADTIAKLVNRAGEDIVIMAGGSVRAHNVADIVRRTGVREVHAWLAKSDQSRDAQTDTVAQLVRALNTFSAA